MNLTVEVYGVPAPQGSKRHVGRGVMVESSKRVRPWRDAVRHETQEARKLAGWEPERGAAYRLDVVFTMARPMSHYGAAGRNPIRKLRASAPPVPVTNPDLDKLVRSTLDGLADGGALINDSTVVELSAVKTYPHRHPDALDSPGAVIVLRPAT